MKSIVGALVILFGSIQPGYSEIPKTVVFHTSQSLVDLCERSFEEASYYMAGVLDYWLVASNGNSGLPTNDPLKICIPAHTPQREVAVKICDTLKELKEDGHIKPEYRSYALILIAASSAYPCKAQ